ncbi:MAG: ribosome maturation factor RimM [Candidatus Eutrophobiaceae bacterium]
MLKRVREQSKADPFGRFVAGRIGSPHGILGWIKIFSWLENRAQIFECSDWYLCPADGECQAFELFEGRSSRHGKSLIARLRGIESRDAANALSGYDISLDCSILPALPEDQYYWRDLMGLSVVNHQGQILGSIVDILDCPAQDVLLVGGRSQRYAIPFVQGVHILRVDLKAGELLVDWHKEWHMDAD